MRMTRKRPRKPGWYWFYSAGEYPVQPVLVFDSGNETLGLLYTLDALSIREDDTTRDGLRLHWASRSFYWSDEPIALPEGVEAPGLLLENIKKRLREAR